jgi:hypothetical protein
MFTMHYIKLAKTYSKRTIEKILYQLKWGLCSITTYRDLPRPTKIRPTKFQIINYLIFF